MDDLETQISKAVQYVAQAIEAVLLSFARIVAIPLSWPGRFIRFTVPPTLHIVLFLSLLPALFIFSASSGVLVAKWLPTGWSERVFLHYGEGLMPYGYVTVNSLASDQPYDVALHLAIPCTEPNYVLGNFMATVTLSTLNNKTISMSQRPALVPPPTGSLNPFKPSLINLVIPLYDSLVTGYSTVRAKVEVGRPDGWKSLGMGEGRELAVADAYLKGTIRPHGLTSWLVMSPMLTGFATAILFFLTSTFIAFILYAAYSPTFSLSPPEVTTDDEDDHALEEPPSPDRPLQTFKPMKRTPPFEVKREADVGQALPGRDRVIRRRRSRDEGNLASSSMSTPTRSS